MPDPMAGVGEDVPPPAMSPDALLILQLIRDTIMSPKPISREQAALEILASCVPSVLNDWTEDADAKLMDVSLDQIVNVSVIIADKLLARLEKP